MPHIWFFLNRPRTSTSHRLVPRRPTRMFATSARSSCVPARMSFPCSMAPTRAPPSRASTLATPGTCKRGADPPSVYSSSFAYSSYNHSAIKPKQENPQYLPFGQTDIPLKLKILEGTLCSDWCIYTIYNEACILNLYSNWPWDHDNMNYF